MSIPMVIYKSLALCTTTNSLLISASSTITEAKIFGEKHGVELHAIKGGDTVRSEYVDTLDYHSFLSALGSLWLPLLL